MTKIEPKIKTSSSSDFVIFVIVGVIQLALIVGMPFYLTYKITESITLSCSASVASYLVFMAFAVHSICFDETGMKLNRTLGVPKFLKWEEIESFKEVDSKEVILWGWLLPPFPPREATPCMSCKGHFRIDYKGGCFYYPPNDKALFANVMKNHGIKEPRTKTKY